jgi:hypothetical protein
VRHRCRWRDPGAALRHLLEAVDLEGVLVQADETRFHATSLRTGATALLQHIRDRWSIENSWHRVQDVPLREDAHRYRENNGVQILATLRSLAINALRLIGIWSITEGIASLAHDIKGLLRLMGWREPAAGTPSG